MDNQNFNNQSFNNQNNQDAYNQSFNNQGFNNQGFNNSGFDQGTQGQYSGYSTMNDQGAQSYNNPNYNYGNNYSVPNNNGKAPKYSLWLTLAIVQMVLGCCCSGGIFTLVTGILTIVFSNNAKDAYNMGDMTTYESKIKAAMITNIIGWVLAVVIGIIAFTTGVFSGFAEALNEM